MGKKVVEKRASANKNSVVKTSNKTKITKSVQKQVAIKPSPKKAKENLLKKKIAAESVTVKAPLKKQTPATPAVQPIAKPSPKGDKKVLVEEKPLPVIVNPPKLKPVKSILISQPKPDLGKSPYIDIAEQFKIKLDWRPFTHVRGISAADFRKQKVYIDQFSCIIFTSRVAIEQYFRMCDELRIKISEENRYFCLSEAIALYLQKFINYRKRKVFFGDMNNNKELRTLLVKHKDATRFLYICAETKKDEIPAFLEANNFNYNEGVMYKTVPNDLKSHKLHSYDMLVFFSPTGIHSLFHNFPKFKQEKLKIAVYGKTTADAALARSLKIHIMAPLPQSPTIVVALDHYIINTK